MTLIFLLLTVFIPALMQGDSTISLNPNRTAVLRLDGDGTFASAVYHAEGGESVTVRVESADGLDVVLELNGPDGQTLAYADAPDGEMPSLVRVRLADSGAYVLRVNSFNGEGRGDVNVTLTVETPAVLRPDQPTVWVPLGANRTATVVIAGFSGAATVSVRDPSGQLDVRVRLIDGDGAALAANDDHGSADVTLNRFDARLMTAAAADMTLEITEFLGRAGWLEVSISP